MRNKRLIENMKFKYLASVLLSTLLIATSAQAELREVDRVVAIVDTGVVLQSEVDETMKRIKDNAASAGQPLPEESELKEKVIDQLVLRRIQLQMAHNMGFQIGDAQLDQTIERLASSENMTVEQMRLKVIQSGDSYEQYREELRDELTINEVKNGSVRRRVYIGPQEIDNLLKMIAEHGNNAEEYNLGHILIALPSNPSETQINAAKTQAENVLAEIKGGQDFKQMAMTTSAGSRALEGGEMGYMNTNEMPTLFANAIKGKGKNDIIGPIQSGAGFHILTIFDIKGRQTVEIQEVKSRHILVRPSIILSEDKAKEMLKGFATQIKNGEKTFEELAKKHSEDPGSALIGGLIDWAEPKIFDPVYKEKLETLEIGRISEPFRSDFGWHIVEVLDRRTQDATEKRKRDQAHRMLFNRKFNEEAENWYHEIRAQAYIEILPEK